MGDMSVDIALAILQASIAIAGLTLVYSAFLIARAADFQGSRRGDKRVLFARLALIPVLYGLVCAWLAVRVVLKGHWGNTWADAHLLLIFQILLPITGFYAILASFMGT
jgi:hypothetical protein